jgi:butyryl-CoA dehydrogenase
MKKAFLVVAGAAVQKLGDKLKEEQEVLLALADVAIQTFAAESALLRAEKTDKARTTAQAELARAAVKVHTFSAAEKVATAARRAAFFVAEGDEATMILGGIRRFTKYDATGLLAAKRLLADAASANEKMPL